MSNIDIVMGVMVTLLFLSSVGVWAVMATRALRGEALIDWEARNSPPWCVADLLLMFIVLAGLVPAAYAIVNRLLGVDLATPLEQLTADNRALSLLVSSTIQVVAVVISIVVVRFRNAASLATIGLSLRRLGHDLRLGLTTFLLVGPIALLIQIITTQIIPSEHPLIELIKEQPELRFAMIGTFSAVIVAPLTEEYAMRGVLQGMLERLSTGKVDAASFLLGLSPPQTTTDQVERVETPTAKMAEAPVSSQPLNPYEPPAMAAQIHSHAPATTDTEFRPAMWPIFFSSLLFALLHWNHGPDWIALFVFAIGLGYVTHRTGRLWPAIIAHMLLNAWSILMLVLAIASES